MAIRVVNHSYTSALRRMTFLLLCCLSPNMILDLRAEDITENPTGMLERLKQRSAAERWQKVKGQYSTDVANPRQNVPTLLSQDQERIQADDEVPPSPEGSFAIPRLTAIPIDTSTDWVLPARPPLDEAVDPPPSRNLSSDNRAVPDPLRFKSEPQQKTAAEVAHRSVNETMAPVDDVAPTTSRSPLQRTMSDIDPFYDRERDSDIREFAIEKAKEFDIPFTPKPFTPRSFPEITLAWDASNLWYHPLYFSDPALERYGHAYHPVVQPFVSIAKSTVQFLFLPYQITIEPPLERTYALGWYRPGDCVPKLHYQPPLNAEAAVVEAGVVAGFYYLIP